MTWHPARNLMPPAILAGVILACAHGGGANQTSASVPPPPIQPPSSLEQLLAGRISGVTVSRAAGGGIVVLINGPTSFYLSNEPLYVVDGVPVEPDRNGALTWLNPQDIASIQVLKGAAAVIYGVRGSNGVVIITTKGTH